MDRILLEMVSTGCLLRPSTTTTSRFVTQFTHASFTRCPASSTIHRELVCSGKAATAGKMIGRDRIERKKKKHNLPILRLLSLLLTLEVLGKEENGILLLIG
jgi:hypothetical protein